MHWDFVTYCDGFPGEPWLIEIIAFTFLIFNVRDHFFNVLWMKHEILAFIFFANIGIRIVKNSHKDSTKTGIEV